jgi:ATP-binding cassette subfamily B protein
MSKSRKSVLWLLWPYLTKYRRLWVGGILSVTLANLFGVAVPWILKGAVDSLTKEVTAKGLALYSGAILGATSISALFTYFMRQTMIVASRKIEYDFRNDLFSHLLELDRPYYDKTPTGDIMARATNDMDSVRNMIGPGIMYFCSTAVRLTFALTLMMAISFKLTLLSMLPMPIITFLVFYLGSEVNKRYTKIQEQYSSITTRAQENFAGIRVVKAYVQEQAEIDDFARMGVDYIKKNMSMVKIWGMFFPAIVLFGSVAIVMVLWFGGKAVVAKTISLGDFVAFSAYLLMLIWPMAALGWVVGLYQRGKASLVRVKEVLDARPVVVGNGETSGKIINGRIEFRDLHFSFDSTPILNGIAVTIEPGMRVAIIGDTGSGKSTLVSLLMRAYPVERGMLFIDDIDVNDYPLETLRSQIAPVMQETFLFSETIKSNIAFGNSGQNTESIAGSAIAAGLASEINEFPHKYDTILGERGITLSGGQKQRAALARALAADPRILILDDAFSSVDTHTEEAILNNLRQVLKGRTTIMISHRVSTVKNADLILVMSHGKIIEKGRHAELLELGGHYASLHEKQLLQDELEAL